MEKLEWEKKNSERETEGAIPPSVYIAGRTSVTSPVLG